MTPPQNEKTPGQIAQEELRHQYGSLFDDISGLLFRHDPVGINFETNRDEYDPEARTILPRLPNCSSEADALRVVHDEFCRWFDADTAGPIQNYSAIAHEIWVLWRQRK